MATTKSAHYLVGGTLMFTQYFSADYRTARERFRSAAGRLGWALWEHPIDGRGPDGNELAVDVAISPPVASAPGPSRAAIVSSGLHGVEGFFGSAVQLAALEREPPLHRVHPDVRFVFVHALNPFGFAWRRRANAENVDLNRNFLLAGETYQGCPEGYRALNPLLNPKRPPARLDGFYLRAAAAVARQGMPALKQAVAEGQYEYPQGLFFGGHRPAQLASAVRAALPDWIGDCREALHLDLHTGLGRWGTYKLLIEQRLSAEQRARLTSRFGEQAWEESSSDGVAYVSRGTFGRWCAAELPQVDYLYACAEFGTYGPLRMLAGLRRENQATHWADEDPAVVERARDRLVELFCPAAAGWRNQVVAAGLDLVERAARGSAART